MSPSDPNSSLAALRQLKEMLDAGTITPQEFETLKRQIVFGAEPALPLTSAAEEPLAPVPIPAPEAPAPEPETTLAAYDTMAPNPAEVPPPPPASPDWLADAPSASTEEDELPLAEERRNPLNLVFAIGGLLVFLGVVGYLLLGRPTQPDEHLTSGTQTAADSTAVVPEVGPQAEQLTLPPVAAPETVRVAPVTPPVPAQNAGQFQIDSAAAPAATTQAPASKVPAAKVLVATPAASPTGADSATKAP
ncbi:MAG: SHOCT domain-containing protein [Janthinobacterium lividum]